MKISVVIATYNGEKFIEDQIHSILLQKRLPDEIVVCDDCSTDNTLNLVTSLLRGSQVEYSIIVNEKNSGVNKTFENAIKKCTGDIVFFSDQDDYWMDNKIEELLSIIENDYADLLFTDAVVVNEKLENLGVNLWKSEGFEIDSSLPINHFDQYEMTKRLLVQNYVTGMTIVCSKQLLEKCMPFPDIVLYDYWIALNASLYGLSIGVNKPYVYYRQHDNNVVGARRSFQFRNFKSKKHNYIRELEKQISICHQFMERITDDNSIPEDIKSFIDNQCLFKMRRLSNIKTCFGLFRIIRNRKSYSEYILRGNRVFFLDILYCLTLRWI